MGANYRNCWPISAYLNSAQFCSSQAYKYLTFYDHWKQVSDDSYLNCHKRLSKHLKYAGYAAKSQQETLFPLSIADNIFFVSGIHLHSHRRHCHYHRHRHCHRRCHLHHHYIAVAVFITIAIIMVDLIANAIVIVIVHVIVTVIVIGIAIAMDMQWSWLYSSPS